MHSSHCHWVKDSVHLPFDLLVYAMYCFLSRIFNLLKQMSNTLVAANVTVDCLRIERDERAQREEETRYD